MYSPSILVGEGPHAPQSTARGPQRRPLAWPGRARPVAAVSRGASWAAVRGYLFFSTSDRSDPLGVLICQPFGGTCADLAVGGRQPNLSALYLPQYRRYGHRVRRAVALPAPPPCCRRMALLALQPALHPSVASILSFKLRFLARYEPYSNRVYTAIITIPSSISRL